MPFLQQSSPHELPGIASLLFILDAIDGAGALDEESARTEHRKYILQDVLLTLTAELHIVETPVTNGLLVLAEHTFSRAGGIGEEGIKL